MSESSVVVVGEAGPLREAVRAAIGAQVAEPDGPLPAARAVVVLDRAPAPVAGPERWAALAGDVVGPLEAAKALHAEGTAPGGVVVVVTGDPEAGDAPARARAAALRSLASSLAVEWAPTTAVVAVIAAEGAGHAAVAAACRYALDAPSGTTVTVGST